MPNFASHNSDAPSIYAIGESLIDIIIGEDDMVSAKPGGSMLNACISLGRLGHQVHFLTESGNDKAADRITSFLTANGVNNEFSVRHNGHKTTMALAWLDRSGNASYSFYQDLPEEAPEIQIPDFNSGDVFLFGSFYAIKERNRINIDNLLKAARKGGATVIYDPNIRISKFADTEETRQKIFSLIDQSDIVKGSDEDFSFIFRTTDQSEIIQQLQLHPALFFLTSGKKGVEVVEKDRVTHHTIPEIVPVSTIGAGDNFNAGIINALITHRITKPYPSDSIALMAQEGIKLSIEVCLRSENYIARR